MGPNGSGKSTLIEAISWVLFGSGSVDRTDKEGIKRSGAEAHEDCSVMLQFELGGVQYQVRRTLRGKSLKADAQLLANGEVLASSERSVTSQVEKVLGMDHRAFFQSVFARQKELSALSALPPAERKKLIVRMLDLDVLQKVIDDIKRDERDEKKDLQFISDQLLTADGRPKREVLEEERASLEEELKVLHGQLDDANKEVERLEVELEKAQGQKEWVALKEKEYRQRDARLLEKRSELKDLTKRREAAEKEIATLKDRLVKLPELRERSEEYRSLLVAKESMEDARVAHEGRGSLLESLRQTDEDIVRAERSMADARTQRQELKDPRASLDKVSENLDALDSEISDKRNDISVAEAEVRRLQLDAEELVSERSKIRSLGPESVCPTCRRTLGEHHTHLVAVLEEQRQEVEAAITAKNADIERLRNELDTLQRRKAVLEERRKKLQDEDRRAGDLDARLKQAAENLDSLRARRNSLADKLEKMGADDFDEDAYRSIKERLPDLRAAADRYQALSGEAARLPDLMERKEELDASIVLRSQEVESMQAELAAIGYEEGDLERAQTAHTEAVRARERGYGEVSLKVEAIEYTERRLADKDKAIADIDEMERSIEGRTRKVQELATLVQVMGDFKQNVMERITPTLSEIASELFDTITDSRYGGIEVDENYDLHIYDGGIKYPLSRFSGGEGDLANLCLRLAISRVLADRSGNDMNFLVLDEIFGSQDQVRKRAIMETLNRLERRFHQIILITHIDDTKDMMSNVVTVRELSDGTSDLLV